MLTVFVPVLLLVKACILAVVCSSVRTQLLIYPNIKHILAPVTEHLAITCEGRASVDGQVIHEDEAGMFTNMAWLNENGTEITENVEKRETTLKLTFLTPSLDDTGTYKCTAGYDKEFEEIVFIEFYVPMSFEECPETLNLIPRKQGKITCRIAANPMPEMIWKKDGKPIDLEEDDEGKFVLTIPSVSEEDGGIYTAEAFVKETGNYLQQNIQVNVMTPPNITHIPEEVTLIQGEINTIKCEATGSEPLTYTWYNEYEKAVNEDNFEYGGLKADQGLLTISNVKTNDHGQIYRPDDREKYYKCEVSNPAGTDEAYVKINVQVSEICKEPCVDTEIHFTLPESEDDLRRSCTTEVEALKCKIQHKVVCEGVEATHPVVVRIYEKLAAVQELYCTENSLFHAVLVDNMECFSKMTDDIIVEKCSADMRRIGIKKLRRRFQKIVRALIKEGLISEDDYKNDTSELPSCLEYLYSHSCHAMKIEAECGTPALFILQEITQKYESLMGRCGEFHPLLLDIVRLSKKEEGEKQTVADASSLENFP